MTRLLAILATLALTFGAAAAEEGAGSAGGASPVPAHVEGDEGSDGSRASAGQSEKSAEDQRSAESDKPAESAAKPSSARESEATKPAEKSAESAKPADGAASARSAETAAAKPSEATEQKTSESDRKLDSAVAPSGADTAKSAQKGMAERETKSESAKDAKADPNPNLRAKPAAKPQDASVVDRAPAVQRVKETSEQRPRATPVRATAAIQAAGSPRPRATATARPASPRGARTAAPDRVREAETVDVAQRITRDSGPITGGILCGGGSKWRCNMIEREHDKFYKFTPGHNWTDQTMATDFCATNKQMRVASATRIKSLAGGCCGFTVVQVTCRR